MNSHLWNFQNSPGYAIRCWGYRGSIISHPKLANPTSSCIHPSTHNQETFGNRLPQHSKSIRYTSYGNTPELPSQYWVASGLSHQQLHKRDFRCRRTKLRYSRTATIKLWRQHLRAQLPGTLPLNPWQEAPRQCSRHKTIGKIPRYPRDPNFFCEIWEEKSQNSMSGGLTRATKGLRSKKNPTLRYIYNPIRIRTFL